MKSLHTNRTIIIHKLDKFSDLPRKFNLNLRAERESPDHQRKHEHCLAFEYASEYASECVSESGSIASLKLEIHRSSRSPIIIKNL